MTFKQCFLLSVFFASLLIGTLLFISKPTAAQRIVAATEQPRHSLYVLPARHIHKVLSVQYQRL